MPSNQTGVTKELIEKAIHCKNADELMALAGSEGITLTKEEAEAYMVELEDVELDGAVLTQVAGGACWDNCHGVGCKNNADNDKIIYK